MYSSDGWKAPARDINRTRCAEPSGALACAGNVPVRTTYPATRMVPKSHQPRDQAQALRKHSLTVNLGFMRPSVADCQMLPNGLPTCQNDRRTFSAGESLADRPNLSTSFTQLGMELFAQCAVVLRN
jgi:hypothetical protein